MWSSKSQKGISGKNTRSAKGTCKMPGTGRCYVTQGRCDSHDKPGGQERIHRAGAFDIALKAYGIFFLDLRSLNHLRNALKNRVMSLLVSVKWF